MHRIRLKPVYGFKENVQLILVNDGSKDNSGEMCEKYFQRFPENIIYIDKENGGVADARNAGMERIEGEYTAFLDSDDYYSQTMLENVYRFFKKKRMPLTYAFAVWNM